VGVITHPRKNQSLIKLKTLSTYYEGSGLIWLILTVLLYDVSTKSSKKVGGITHPRTNRSLIKLESLSTYYGGSGLSSLGLLPPFFLVIEQKKMKIARRVAIWYTSAV
jgi:hypothetical protein